MSTSEPTQYLATVRAALNTITPTFIRGSMPGTLPDECIIIDPITVPVTNDFNDEYATILLQVTAWSSSLGTAGFNARAADAVMKSLGWKVVGYRLAPTDDDFKGVQADYERHY
jgi:hypothetical protein